MKLYLDTETVGLNGPLKLIQYSIDDGPVEFINMSNPGYEGCKKLVILETLLRLPNTLFVGFNVSFDLFHLYRMIHERVYGLDLSSPDRPVKPFLCKVLDLQVHAMLKSPLSPFAFSRSRSRSIALLRRVPIAAEPILIDKVGSELASKIPAHFKLKLSRHEVKTNPELITLSWSVEGGVGLKPLMKEYGIPTMELAEVWPLPPREIEQPWLPYYDYGVYEEYDKQCDRIMANRDSPFWKYATLDILYLKILYEKLGRPEPDIHSSCASAVAYTRYHGFGVDRNSLNRSKAVYQSRLNEIESKLRDVDLNSFPKRLAYLRQWFPLLASTNKHVLKQLADEPGVGGDAIRAMLDYKPTQQRIMQIDKLLGCRTGRAHPDFRVMGTGTGRMAGTAGLNWQGIGQAESVEEEELEALDDALLEDEADYEYRSNLIGIREAIEVRGVGDFSSFEVCIAESIYNDPQLTADLQNKIDLHSMTAATAHPDVVGKSTYEQVYKRYKDGEPLATKQRKSMKSVVFGIFYFAQAHTIARSMGITEAEAQKVLDRFLERYQGIGRYRNLIESRFITADVNRWSRDSVSRMDTRQVDLTGFERRWEFEKEIAETFWMLGRDGIKTGMGGSVVRTVDKGKQTIDNAIRSALLGSAIAIQAAVSRQAGNMPVQATGANLCKRLMASLWERYHTPMMCIHDEILFAVHPNYSSSGVYQTINEFEEEHRSMVKFLKFDYKECQRWAQK